MRCDSSAKLSGEARTISGERVDKFEDIEIIRYNVPGFESLSLNEKLMIYYKVYKRFVTIVLSEIDLLY